MVYLDTRWFRPDASAFDLPEIRGPYDSNYAWSPSVVSWVMNTVEEKGTEAIEYWSLYCTSTAEFLVVYKLSKEWNILSNCCKCLLVKLVQKPKIKMHVWMKHCITTAQTFNDLSYLFINWLAYLYGRIQSPSPDHMPDRREGITRAEGFGFACIDTQAS